MNLTNLNLMWVIPVIVAVGIGVLVNAQFIDNEWATRAFDLLIGGVGGVAIATKGRMGGIAKDTPEAPPEIGALR